MHEKAFASLHVAQYIWEEIRGYSNSKHLFIHSCTMNPRKKEKFKSNNFYIWWFICYKSMWGISFHLLPLKSIKLTPFIFIINDQGSPKITLFCERDIFVVSSFVFMQILKLSLIFSLAAISAEVFKKQ